MMPAMSEKPYFQSLSTEQGRKFELLVVDWFVYHGFRVLTNPGSHDIHPPIPDVGVRPDLLAIYTAGSIGAAVLVECKGSFRGSRPGLLRTDSVKKAVGDAYTLHHAAPCLPYVLVTSHLPQPGSAGDKMLKTAQEAGAVFEVLKTWEPGDMTRLCDRLGGLSGEGRDD